MSLAVKKNVCMHLMVLNIYVQISSPKLVEFIDHCCVSRTYFFTVKKCGASDCQICAPPRLPIDIFSQLHNFPDPVPGI